MELLEGQSLEDCLSALPELSGGPVDVPAGSWRRYSLSGGDINRAYLCRAPEASVFVKMNVPAFQEVFRAEARGLEEWGRAAKGTGLKVPRVLGLGLCPEGAFLALEYLDLGGRPDTEAWQEAGRALAILHSALPTESGGDFGWLQDNYIGSTLQQNTRTRNWAEFWCRQRLEPQLAWASGKAGKISWAPELLDRARAFLEAAPCPGPSLVHGDLWRGNLSFLPSGQAVLFDPAAYWGDPETDLAMCRLFGGFPPVFFQAYEAAQAQARGSVQAGNPDLPSSRPGKEARNVLYQIYHVLNHYNLFGGSYLQQAQSLAKEFQSFRIP